MVSMSTFGSNRSSGHFLCLFFFSSFLFVFLSPVGLELWSVQRSKVRGGGVGGHFQPQSGSALGSVIPAILLRASVRICVCVCVSNVCVCVHIMCEMVLETEMLDPEVFKVRKSHLSLWRFSKMKMNQLH